MGEIKNLVLKKYHPGYSILFSDDKYSAILRNKLSEKSLGYRVLLRNGREIVAWEKDNDEVQKLIVEVSKMVSDDRKQKWKEILEELGKDNSEYED